MGAARPGVVLQAGSHLQVLQPTVLYCTTVCDVQSGERQHHPALRHHVGVQPGRAENMPTGTAVCYCTHSTITVFPAVRYWLSSPPHRVYLVAVAATHNSEENVGLARGEFPSLLMWVWTRRNFANADWTKTYQDSIQYCNAVCRNLLVQVNVDDYLPGVMTCATYLKLSDYSSQKIMKKKLRLADS